MCVILCTAAESLHLEFWKLLRGYKCEIPNRGQRHAPKHHGTGPETPEAHSKWVGIKTTTLTFLFVDFSREETKFPTDGHILAA